MGGVQSGGNVTGLLEAGELEVVSVDAVAGAGIMAAMGDVDRVSGFYPQLTIYGPDGALLATNWDYDRATATATTTTTGAHYVVASGNGDGVGGRFSLFLGVQERLPGTGQFAGTVRKRADNAPVADAMVQVWSAGKLRAMGWTGSNGTYQLSALAAGVYELRVLCPGFFAQALPGFVVLEHQTTTVNFLLDSQAGGVPAISALTPVPVLAVNQRQWLTLFGSGFQADTVVVLRTGGETYQIPQDRTVFVSSTQIKGLANLTSQPAAWTAQVVNSGGRVSALFPFQVQAPPTFQLGFPLAGKTPYTAEIVSVFDHNMTTPYQPDNSVMASSGEVGTVRDPDEPRPDPAGTLWSFKKTLAEAQRTGSAAFLLGGANYTGTRTTHATTVNYDGHPGYDYRVPTGTPVLAAADGVVHWVLGSRFNTIYIDHGNYTTHYLHLNDCVWPDQTAVKRGQLIAHSGWAGLDSQMLEHLHFEVRLQPSGAPVDPYGWEGVPGTDPYTPQSQNLWDAALQLDESLTGFAVNQQQTGVQVSFKGEVGRTCVFQASEDLTSWTPLQTVVNTLGRILFRDTDPKQCRFYKVTSR